MAEEGSGGNHALPQRPGLPEGACADRLPAQLDRLQGSFRLSHEDPHPVVRDSTKETGAGAAPAVEEPRLQRSLVQVQLSGS